MENLAIIGILFAIAAGIAWYLLRKKKQGRTCVGCPHGGKCAGCK